MKRFILFGVALAIILSLGACTNEKSTANNKVENTTEESSVDVQKGYVFIANVLTDCFEKTEITFTDASDIIDALIEKEAVSENVVLNSFHSVGKIGWVDLNEAFSEGAGAGTYAEWMWVGAIVNSFCESYKLEKLIITIDGDVFVTGHHGSFDHFIEPYPNLV